MYGEVNRFVITQISFVSLNNCKLAILRLSQYKRVEDKLEIWTLKQVLFGYVILFVFDMPFYLFSPVTLPQGISHNITVKRTVNKNK